LAIQLIGTPASSDRLERSNSARARVLGGEAVALGGGERGQPRSVDPVP
jgi:hypothetical protein